MAGVGDDDIGIGGKGIEVHPTDSLLASVLEPEVMADMKLCFEKLRRRLLNTGLE